MRKRRRERAQIHLCIISFFQVSLSSVLFSFSLSLSLSLSLYLQLLIYTSTGFTLSVCLSLPTPLSVSVCLVSAFLSVLTLRTNGWTLFLLLLLLLLLLSSLNVLTWKIIGRVIEALHPRLELLMASEFFFLSATTMKFLSPQYDKEPYWSRIRKKRHEYHNGCNLSNNEF